jgi:hypothetical protein
VGGAGGCSCWPGAAARCAFALRRLADQPPQRCRCCCCPCCCPLAAARAACLSAPGHPSPTPPQAPGLLVPKLLGAADTSSLEGSLADHFLRDHTGSHLMEAVVQVGAGGLWGGHRRGAEGCGGVGGRGWQVCGVCGVGGVGGGQGALTSLLQVGAAGPSVALACLAPLAPWPGAQACGQPMPRRCARRPPLPPPLLLPLPPRCLNAQPAAI